MTVSAFGRYNGRNFRPNYGRKTSANIPVFWSLGSYKMTYILPNSIYYWLKMVVFGLKILTAEFWVAASLSYFLRLRYFGKNSLSVTHYGSRYRSHLTDYAPPTTHNFASTWECGTNLRRDRLCFSLHLPCSARSQSTSWTRGTRRWIWSWKRGAFCPNWDAGSCLMNNTSWKTYMHRTVGWHDWKWSVWIG